MTKITLEHHAVSDEAFAAALAPIGGLLMQARDAGQTILALEQDLRWYGGRIDRMAITRAIAAPQLWRTSLTALERGVFVPMAVLSSLMHCADAFNRPLNISCSEMAVPEDGALGGEVFEGAAFFIAGGILVAPDALFDGSLSPGDAEEPVRRMAKVLVPTASSNHAVMAGHAAAHTGSALLAALLRAEGIDADIDLHDASLL